MTVSRRTFLATGAAAAAAAGVQSLGAQGATPRELYELRTYRLRRGPNEQRMADYFRDALVPALRRVGTGPVGVFTVAAGPDSPSFYVLIPHQSAESVATLPDRLASDAEYQRAAAPVAQTPASNPAYDRVESSLLLAFTGMPKLAVPPQLAAGRGRLFELRRYESHSARASRTKIDMFNQAEIAIFAKHGMHAVFYGQTIIGPHMPNLTYLLAFDNMQDRDTRWGAFGSDPDFRALISKPEFSDAAIITSITNYFLRPTSFSQI